MKIVTLLENTAGREGLRAAHGLSLYIETPRHKLLFDMGPNEDFLANAGALGVLVLCDQLIFNVFFTSPF